MKHYILMTAIAGLGLSACAPAPVEQTLTIYSARHYDSDTILYKKFEEKTGVKIQVREARANQLLETLKAEGDKSEADLVISADAGALWRFQDAGLTQGVSDDRLNAAIPAKFREPDGNWFGLAKRIRVIAYNPERYTIDQVDEWEDLTSEDKRGEICVRSSSNIYNLSLMAEMIERVGEEKAQTWANGVAANMARTPRGGDRDQIRAIAAGECSVAIVNHYYWVRLAESEAEDDREAAASSVLSVPTFSGSSGAHVNVTGAAITSMADDTKLAADFIAYVLSPEGQELLTQETKEIPLIEGTPMPVGLARVPEFEAGETPLKVFGENQADAQRLYDLADWK